MAVLTDLKADEIESWPKLGHEDLLARLAKVTAELVELYRELGTSVAEERRAKNSAWFSVQARTNAERDRFAEHQALAQSNVVSELRGRIQGVEAARDFILVLTSR